MKLENLKEDDFEIEVVQEGDMIELFWKGTLGAPDPDEFLDPYFDKLIETARTNKMSVRCNFTNLDYMNSASIPPLIQLLRRMAENEIRGEYAYNAGRKVQAASFRALDVIARKSEYTTVIGV